jgi:hypothetical protein
MSALGRLSGLPGAMFSAAHQPPDAPEVAQAFLALRKRGWLWFGDGGLD